MQQMNVPEEYKVAIDYEDLSFPSAVKTLQPLLFTDGSGFCCVLGPDFKQGVMGCGISAEAALLDWEKNLRKRLVAPVEGDEVAAFIIDKMAATVNDIG